MLFPLNLVQFQLIYNHMQEEKIEGLQFHQQEEKGFINNIKEREEQKMDEIDAEQPLHQEHQKKRGKGRPKREKKSKENPKPSIRPENQKRGHWTLEENKRYHWFLEIYHNHFIKREMRRLDKIFKTMANFIGTREAQQCRSHHQKMQKKYETFSAIILVLRQNHYGTEETHPILEQMNMSGVNQTGVLLDPASLKRVDGSNGERVNMPRPEEHKNEEMIQISNFLDLGEGMNSNNLPDMLGDNYELQLELDNLII